MTVLAIILWILGAGIHWRLCRRTNSLLPFAVLHLLWPLFEALGLVAAVIYVLTGRRAR